VPKELLPIIDKPVIQYLVEEAVAAGIKDIVIVTRSGAGQVAAHFDSSRELEVYLTEQKKYDYLAAVKALPTLANFCQVHQGSHLPYGNGTPILAASPFLRNEPFAYMFGDDIVLSQTPCIRQLIDVYEAHQPAAVVAFQKVPSEEISRYASAKVKPDTDPMELEFIVEKAPPEKAPSLLAQLGRFVLHPQIIDILARRELGLGNELYLTDAIDKLCRKNRVIAHPIEGRWHTTGDPLRFLITSIECALRREDIAHPLAAYLRSIDLSKY